VEEILQAAEAAERTVDGQVDDVESMQTNIVETEVAGDQADRESHGAKGKRQAGEPEVCYGNLFLAIFRFVYWDSGSTINRKATFRDRECGWCHVDDTWKNEYTGR
jgi:hypothetical protein